MRNTIIYFKNIFEKNIFNFSGEGSSIENGTSDIHERLSEKMDGQKITPELIKEYKKDIISWIEAMSKNDGHINFLSLNDLKNGKEANLWDEIATIANKLGVKSKYLGYDIKSYIDILNRYQGDVNRITGNGNRELYGNFDDTKSSLDDLNKILTGEDLVTLYGKSFSREEAFNIVNKKSILEILKSENLDINKLYLYLENILSSQNKKGNVFLLKSIINKSGYKYKGLFTYNEVIAFYKIITETKNIQEKFNRGIPTQEKLKYLVDFDMNGALEKDITFNSGELEALEAIKDEKTFNNVLDNLGLNSSEFNKSLKQNYFGARENFKTALARFAEMDLTSFRQLLLPKDMFQESMKRLMSVNANPELSRSLDNALKGINVSSEVKTKALSIITGVVNGGNFTTDSIGKELSELTRGVLDNVSFGYADGKIGLIIGGGKEFLNGKVNVSGGLTNFVPFLSVSGDIITPKSTKIEQINGDKNTEVGITLNGTATPLIVGGGVSFNRMDEQTSKGIREMVAGMSKTVDSILLNLNKGFEAFVSENGLSDIKPKEKTNLKNFYDNLVNSYNSFGKLDPVNFKRGVMKAYQNKLYENAKGIKFSGVNISIFGPILIGGLSFEKISQSYNKKDTQKADAIVNSLFDEKNYQTREKEVETIEHKELTNFDETAINNVNKLKPQISNIIDIKDIKKLGSLETSIHNLLNGRAGLSKVWGDFQTEMAKLKKDISFIGEPSDSEKILILQTVAINLMKKEKLSITDNLTVEFKDKNQTISGYDSKHKRSNYFDKIFGKELPSVSSSIKAARNEYYAKFGNTKSYEIGQVPVNGGVGFTGVEIGTGKGKINSLNPYVSGSIAAIGGEAMKVPLTLDKAGFDQMVDKLPNHLIEPLISQLESAKYDFQGGDKISKMRDILKTGKAGEITIEKNAYFAKAAECLNDTVFMDFKISYKGKKIIPGESITPPGEWGTNTGENNATNINIGVAYENKDNTGKNTDNQDGGGNNQDGGGNNQDGGGNNQDGGGNNQDGGGNNQDGGGNNPNSDSTPPPMVETIPNKTMVKYPVNMDATNAEVTNENISFNQSEDFPE